MLIELNSIYGGQVWVNTDCIESMRESDSTGRPTWIVMKDGKNQHYVREPPQYIMRQIRLSADGHKGEKSD